VTEILRSRGIPFALIGAAAMAVHGISRSTSDLDLFTLAPECLEASTWAALAQSGIDARLRRGDIDDPLAGVARFTAAGDDPVDVIVGKSRWQVGILDRSRETTVEGSRVPVAGPADLIALKLYAGGPQDAWDIDQLLGASDGPALAAAVEQILPDLPDEARALWARIRGGR
jgi:predicted nucleotidyltransferase